MENTLIAIRMKGSCRQKTPQEVRSGRRSIARSLKRCQQLHPSSLLINMTWSWPFTSSSSPPTQCQGGDGQLCPDHSKRHPRHQRNRSCCRQGNRLHLWCCHHCFRHLSCCYHYVLVVKQNIFTRWSSQPRTALVRFSTTTLDLPSSQRHSRPRVFEEASVENRSSKNISVADTMSICQQQTKSFLLKKLS